MTAARTSLLHRLWSVVFDLPREVLSYRWGLCVGFVLATFPFLGSTLTVFICGMGVVAGVYLIAFRHTILPLESGERWAAIILTAYCAISLASSLLHENRLAGLASTFNNLGFLFALPLLPVLRHYRRPYWSDWGALACAAGGILAGAVALLQNVYVNGRVEALTGNSLIFAYVAGLSGLFNLWLALSLQGRMRYLHLVATMSSTIALVASGGRFALLSFAVVALSAVAFRLASVRLRPTATTFFRIYVCIVIAVGAFELVRDTSVFEQALSRFQPIASFLGGRSDGGDSVHMRLSMQSAGLTAFAESPWLGYGRQNVMSVVNGVSANDPSFIYSHLHNAYLTEAVASGAPGLIAFILVLGLPLIVTSGGRGPWRGVAVMLTAYTVLYSLTNIGFGHDIKVFTYAALTVALAALSRHPKAGEDTAASG